jgi:hypothetical protein
VEICYGPIGTVKIYRFNFDSIIFNMCVKDSIVTS